jgi:methyltransferase (TIGR00027 family)
MARTDNDTWDLASSVGVTATLVAAARAAATRTDDALISDPFAEPLVTAVGVEPLTKLASGEIDFASLADEDAEAADAARRFADAMAVRTKFFDDFFHEAGSAGIRQAVILASGLDARAYRLPWPDGTVVFEIDQPAVIEFKTAKLAELGATPTAERRAVAVDLRDYWPAALCAAGFDPAKPAAWIAEGLLGYLPPDAQDRLLDSITALSVPGNRFACETAADTGQLDHEEVKERMQTASDRWREHGFDIDFVNLIYIGERNPVPAYLAAHGWDTHGSTSRELFTQYGLEPPPLSPATWGEMLYLTGVLRSGQ